MNLGDTFHSPSIEERRVMAKTARRLMPILIVMFLIAFIDRGC